MVLYAFMKRQCFTCCLHAPFDFDQQFNIYLRINVLRTGGQHGSVLFFLIPSKTSFIFFVALRLFTLISNANATKRIHIIPLSDLISINHITSRDMFHGIIAYGLRRALNSWKKKTDGLTDHQTDRPFYRDVMIHLVGLITLLKRQNIHRFSLL